MTSIPARPDVERLQPYSAPLEGRRKFKGRILGTANDKVQLDQDGTEVELEPGNIAKARLVPDYDSLFTKREEAR